MLKKEIVVLSDQPASGPTRPFDLSGLTEAEAAEIRPREKRKAELAQRDAELRARAEAWNTPRPQTFANNVLDRAIAEVDPWGSSEIKELRELLERRNNANTIAINFSQSAAREAFQQQRAAIAENIAKGITDNPKDAWSRADFDEDFEKRRRAAKEVRSKADQRIGEILKAGVVKLAHYVAQLAANVARSDAIEFEKFEHPHVETQLTKALRAFAWHLANYDGTNLIAPVALVEKIINRKK